MTTLNRRQLLALGAAPLASALPVGAAHAADYPSRQVKFIVPFPPGGPVDTTARAFVPPLGQLWGQSTFIDNRAGGGGIVGAETAAKQAPDGYGLFVGAIHHSVNPALHPKLSYNIQKDFVPISFAAMFPVFLVVNPSVPAKNVQELIALAKKPGSNLSFSSSGNGGGTHLAGELFNMHAGTQLLHIPYKGSAPAMTDVLGGQVAMMFSDAPTAIPHIKTGKVRVLGVASPKRSALLPDVPTIAEQGLPGYEAYSWAALFAPAGTPKEVVAKINTDFNQVMRDPDVKQRLYVAGAEANPGTPEDLAKLLQAEMDKWAKVVKAANIKID
ncbi:tripartite tricarboxylate transporter substrate binding protein [Comamonas sp. J-3]|uniref:tripartite tricarboxylate transporter substrate binding protein n=1 Tax=Comamonas trifloxystrobinivorans TaxID=3350256 RepID=UPI0037265685